LFSSFQIKRTIYKIGSSCFFFVFFVACSSGSDTSDEDVEVNLPSLNTITATSITENSATVGGDVTNDGGGQVTDRGVVWGMESNPMIADSKISKGHGTGEFSVSLPNLLRNTQYFVRAFAINAKGTAYGNEIDFTTHASLASITTNEVTEITENSAISGGVIAEDGGAEITARGVCWSTSTNPTVDDNKTEDGEGVGEFESSLLNLDFNTEYFVRAYSENMAGITYGNEVSFSTEVLTNKTFVGDVYLKTQQEVDDFGIQNYQQITGKLTIGDRSSLNESDINDLSTLNSLIEIGSKLDIWNNDNLQDFDGFENLVVIGGDIEINGNDQILNVAGFDSLISISGELFVRGNDSLLDVDGFTGVISSAIRIRISRNNKLKNLSAFIGASEINGELDISENASLLNLNGLDGLKVIHGNLVITGNSDLTDISSLYNLEVVEGMFVLAGTSISEINGFNQLSSVLAGLTISGNSSLTVISGFSNLIDSGKISIDNNSLLTEINGFESTVTLNGDFVLLANESLYNINGFNNLSSIQGNLNYALNRALGLDFLSNLNLITEDLRIGPDDHLFFTTGLRSLNRVGGDMDIYNLQIQDINDLDNLESVGGDLIIRLNSNLQNIKLPSLNIVSGNVEIKSNLNLHFTLEDIWWKLNSIGGDLIIRQNNSGLANIGMTNLKSFQNLTEIKGNIEIIDNLALRDFCSLQMVLDTFTGIYSVSGNVYNPTQQNILDGNCSN